MRAVSGALRYQAIALMGVVERNTYLVKRYGWWELAFFVWTVANTLTIVFIAKGVEATGGHARRRAPDREPADRRGDLVLPRDRVRDPHRDRRVGALGGDDRVHVHGAAAARRCTCSGWARSPCSTASCARRRCSPSSRSSSG